MNKEQIIQEIKKAGFDYYTELGEWKGYTVLCPMSNNEWAILGKQKFILQDKNGNFWWTESEKDVKSIMKYFD